MFSYAWLSVMTFCECVVRCLCMQVLCRGGVCLVKFRMSVVNLLSVLYVGCVCSAYWWQCGVVRNCSAWFVLVNVEFVERVHFDGEIFLHEHLKIHTHYSQAKVGTGWLSR